MKPGNIPCLLVSLKFSSCCGSGLSGETLSEDGNQWTDVALVRDVEGDLLLTDMYQDLGFMDGAISGDISISVVQDLLISFVKVFPFIDSNIGGTADPDLWVTILGKNGWLKGSFQLLHFMEGRRFLDTKTLTVEEEDKKKSIFTVSIFRRIESGLNLEEAVPCISFSKNDTYVMSATGGKISLFNMMTYKVTTIFVPPPPASTYIVKSSIVVFEYVDVLWRLDRRSSRDSTRTDLFPCQASP
ncbi:hypothetical protein C5167_025140 [Papaver somniferum]|uniref:Uncharacterized protein n=1 Tax=Papaver somniferum TaxID=3469 RepID=A0A4Y7JTV8_PAPSO|nr:hypothetical protein C5167_025140 [Papaver somniferum]